MKLKERMPIWMWALLIVGLVLTPVLVCIHVFGILDLSFFGVAFLGFFNWAGADIVNGIVALALAVFAFGSLGYLIKGYTGIKTPPGQPGIGYAPNPTYPSQTASEENKTVIS